MHASCCHLALGNMTYPKLREGLGCHLGHYPRDTSHHRILPSTRDSGARFEYQLKNAEHLLHAEKALSVCCVKPAYIEHLLLCG